jgi:hypothetical protein
MTPIYISLILKVKARRVQIRLDGLKGLTRVGSSQAVTRLLKVFTRYHHPGESFYFNTLGAP